MTRKQLNFSTISNRDDWIPFLGTLVLSACWLLEAVIVQANRRWCLFFLFSLRLKRMPRSRVYEDSVADLNSREVGYFPKAYLHKSGVLRTLRKTSHRVGMMERTFAFLLPRYNTLLNTNCQRWYKAGKYGQSLTCG